MSCRSLKFAVLLSALILSEAARASSIAQKLTFEELATQADVIVRGRVTESKTSASADGSFLTIRIAVSVEEQFKGQKVSSVTLTLPGGSVGNVVQGSAGTPEFTLGEEVFLFLHRRRNQDYRLVGGKQGKFTARPEPGSNQKVVEDLAHRTESYDSFVDRLTKALKQQK
jgi:hypothetical protein